MVLLPVANQQQRGKHGSGGSSSGGSSSSGGTGGGGGGGYEGLIGAGRQRILQTLAEAGLGDVGAAIQHETVIAPPDWEQRYGLRHGAAFGLAHGLDQLSIFRWGEHAVVVLPAAGLLCSCTQQAARNACPVQVSYVAECVPRARCPG